jgi:hypothetical protein
MVFKVRFFGLVLLALVAGAWPVVAQAAASTGPPAPRMGAALLTFAVLGGSTVTNTGPTIVTGNLGVSPGTSVTGFPPGIVTGGAIFGAPPSALAAQAHSQLATAYADAKAAASPTDLTGKDLGTLTLGPGVYKFSSSAQLTGTLHLNGNGVYIFQIGSTLTTATGSAVVLAGGAVPCGVYWQVGSSATLGTGTQFQGNLMALTSITLVTGANIVTGRALALNGAVTMDTNHVTMPPSTCAAAPGSCKQGKSKDTDENSDHSKDTAGNNKSASSSSKSDSKDENGKNSEGNSDKGNKGCDLENSKKDNSNQDMSKQDNSNRDNTQQSD